MAIRDWQDIGLGAAAAGPTGLVAGLVAGLGLGSSLGAAGPAAALGVGLGAAAAAALCRAGGAGHHDDCGMARGPEVRHALSVGAARKAAEVTRPGLGRPHRAEAFEVGIGLGRTADLRRRKLYATHEDVVLALAPPRTGKTAWLGNVIVDAPGACVVTSTRTDVVGHTARLRAMTRGPVLVFNPEGLGGLRSSLRWSPLVGCEAPATAIQRAGDLLAGAPNAGGTEDRNFWESNAAKVLRCYLFAAAITGRSMAAVADWAGDPTDRTALRILENHSQSPAGWAEALGQVLDGPERTRGSVFMTLALIFEFMADPVLAQAVLPELGKKTFDVSRFLETRSTLYLLAEDRPYGSLAPLFSAFVAHLHRSAKALAEACPGGRLDPPLMLALDEAPLICPVPLERWTSDSGGRGIPIVISVQGRAWLEHRWGRTGGRIIWNNATSKIMFGANTDEEHLSEVSRLCGERDEHIVSHSRSPDGHRSTSTSVRRLPVMSHEKLRTLGQFRAVLVHRSTRPVLVRIRPVWERPDVKAANNAAQAPRTNTGARRSGPAAGPEDRLAPVVALAPQTDTSKVGNVRSVSDEAVGE